MLLVAEDDRLVTASRPLTSAHGSVRDDLLGCVLFEAPCRVHTVNRLGLTGARTCSRSRGRRLSHLHIVTVRRAQF